MKNRLAAAAKIAQDQLLATDDNDRTGFIDVTSALIQLLHCKEWTAEQNAFFHGWMKKLDIAKKHYCYYHANWKLDNSQKTGLKEKYYQLSLLLVLQFIERHKKSQNSAAQIIKTCNVAWKLLDRVSDVFGLDADTIDAYIEQQIVQGALTADFATPNSPLKAVDAKVLPITVLFWEGPIARAYLSTIKAMGFKVQKIIKLVSCLDLVTKKPVGSLLPQKMKVKYAANKQYKQMFYWPNSIKIKHKKFVEDIQSKVTQSFEFSQKTLTEALQNIPLEEYSHKVESLFISGLKDPLLLNQLEKDESDLFLFTGGGIVPAELLDIEAKRLIHIHPGYLPEIRGADCVLWSQILVNRTSATSFFLAPGIDVGDIILANWLPELRVEFPVTNDIQLNYRSTYGYIDPWVRAYVLRNTVLHTNGLSTFNTESQSEKEGLTYHFMHPKFKTLAFKAFA